MAITADQKIEFIKIIIGVIFSVIGALWTYTIYTENARNSELNTLNSLGDSIAGMNVTCSEDYRMLSKLANETNKDSKKGRCYAYWEDAHKKSLSAVITVKKPIFCSPNKWVDDWNTLQVEIIKVGSQKYSFAEIDKAWKNILISKGLKITP
jgi:hypothetical protein